MGKNDLSWLCTLKKETSFLKIVAIFLLLFKRCIAFLCMPVSVCRGVHMHAVPTEGKRGPCIT